MNQKQDRSKEMKDLVESLRDEQLREDAERELLDIGKEAVPFVLEKMGKSLHVFREPYYRVLKKMGYKAMEAERALMMAVEKGDADAARTLVHVSPSAQDLLIHFLTETGRVRDRDKKYLCIRAALAGFEECGDRLTQSSITVLSEMVMMAKYNVVHSASVILEGVGVLKRWTIGLYALAVSIFAGGMLFVAPFLNQAFLSPRDITLERVLEGTLVMHILVLFFIGASIGGVQGLFTIWLYRTGVRNRRDQNPFWVDIMEGSVHLVWYVMWLWYGGLLGAFVAEMFHITASWIPIVIGIALALWKRPRLY